MTTYGWVEGAPFNKVDANIVRAELQRIAETAEGGLTPENVVAAARSKRSPLHPLIFDGMTAEQALEVYHLSRARVLLRAVVLVVDGEEKTIRAFVRITTESGRDWRSIELPEARDAEIARLRSMMQHLAQMLTDLDEYPAVVVALEEALA